MTSLADRQQEAENIGRSIKTPQELWEAYEVLADLERALVAAGARLHEQGHSWGALAAPFGITRQGARKRWGLAATSAVDPTLDDNRDDPDTAATV